MSSMSDRIPELTLVVFRKITVSDLSVEKYFVVILPGETVREPGGQNDGSMSASLKPLSRESCKFPSLH